MTKDLNRLFHKLVVFDFYNNNIIYHFGFRTVLSSKEIIQSHFAYFIILLADTSNKWQAVARFIIYFLMT